MKFLYSFILSVAMVTAGYSQGALNLIQRLDSLRTAYPIEKIHLHLDKPYYAAGQTIWLKAYVVDGVNRPSMLSKIVYVELIDQKNNVCKYLKLPLSAGLASGELALEDTLSEGNYRLRAYTRWMRNFGEESFYNQKIAVGNLLSSDVLTKTSYALSKGPGEGDLTEAIINYTTLNGSALADKEVNFQVQLNEKRIERGKSVTDNNGIFRVKFESKGEIINSGFITTSFKHHDKILAKTIPIKTTNREISIQFFPEGGQLVDSLPSKVAFKATGSAGKGIDVSGYVIDELNARVADLKSDFAGMGSFMLSPYGRKYVAVINLPGGERRVELPQARKEGYVLSLRNEDDKNLYIRVAASSNMPRQELAIVVQGGIKTHSVSRFNLNRQFVDLAVSKDGLPTGIVKLTLLADDIPQAERLKFINQHDQLDLRLTGDKDNYKPREKVSMNLSARDNDLQPINGSFSVSVTDLSQVPISEEDDNTILSDLLIKSELRGYVEKPNYYFIDTTKERKVQLDNLMLTQGWRRFDWKKHEVAGSRGFKPETGIEISGNILLRGTPLAGGKVTLFTPDGGIYLDTLTDANGRFEFDKLAFQDGTRFLIQGRNKNDRTNVQIRLNRNVPQEVTLTPPHQDIEENINESMLSYLKDGKAELEELNKQGLIPRTNMLEEVVVAASRNPRLVENSSNLSKIPADYVFRPDQLSGQNLGLALEGKILGLEIKYDPLTQLTTASVSRNDLLSGKVPMRLFVDGVDYGYDLSGISLSEVAVIEVIKAGSAIYGNKGFGGAIIVTTKVFAGVPSETAEEPQGLLQHTPKGYTLAREFYSPHYDLARTRKDIRDLRTTIYWNPDLVGDNGNYPVEFYTADRPGKYKVIIEGIDYRGMLGRKVYIFDVTSSR